MNTILKIAVILNILFAFSLAAQTMQKVNVAATPYDSYIQLHAQNLAQAFKQLNTDTPKLTAILTANNNQELLKANRQKLVDTLDSLTVFEVTLSATSQVNIVKGNATPLVTQAGWANYLIKVINPHRLKGDVIISSPNALPIYHKSVGEQYALQEHFIDDKTIDTSFLELAIYRDTPLSSTLSTFPVEYRILQIYTREKGTKTATFYSEFISEKTPEKEVISKQPVILELPIKAATKVIFNIQDQSNGSPVAAFTISDGVSRFRRNGDTNPLPKDYRRRFALRRPWERIWHDRRYRNSVKAGQRLTGIYPLPSMRLPIKDRFPDFYFQAQIYRKHGEYVYLPAGNYEIEFTRGPEYLAQKKFISVAEGTKVQQENFQLKRWTNLSELGWYSSDLHVHASGCKHYETPTNGVPPEYIWRQALGEDLNVTSVLNWGVGWYDQKKYFEQQKTHPFATHNNLLRYDVEVSEMPSAHLGHLGLWNLTEDDYPNTQTLEEWPSWTAPILKWAKSQGASTGYVHTGWGMLPDHQTYALPNYAIPQMSGIGANEYIVTLPQQTVDLYGVGDTVPSQELNTWYHALNSGFRTRLVGESDFPCISHEKIGVSRGYAKLDKNLNFDNYIQQMENGRSYVSDGRSHIIDVYVEGKELGIDNSEVHLTKNKNITIQAKVSAYLPKQQNELGLFIANSSPQRQPAWDIERARLAQTREVYVELIVNGVPVDTQIIEANGDWNDVKFNYHIEYSSWVALRIFPSSHTNPHFVLVKDKPIRASKRSTKWLLSLVDRLWKIKSGDIKESEKAAAFQDYKKAKKAYQAILVETEIE
ncbi:CehA/McbA family metallohydrolase [Paraglaciecola arctica]|uniref:CehA/McbA family metallohydrolase n=1 Tax=Paraglaciecola arctica TaxID=1128911 RepID=UPI001C064ED8|nr:CehA/McbA family metallohydrolase [Paraglaciecola arctica]MBU3004249.1 CehA/McbA family metallohydrolase [Paraglaciecola arctica]